MECKVCQEPYDQRERRPRVVPCGHMFCSMCIDSLIIDGCLTCPNCRAEHSASTGVQFPFAFEFEELILAVQSNSVSSQPNKSMQESRGLSKRLDTLKQEEESTILSSTSDCKDMLTQLQTYCTSLDEIVNDHRQLTAKLEEAIKEHKEQEKVLLQQKQSALLFKEKGVQHQQNNNNYFDSLEKAITAEEMGRAIDEAANGSEEVRKWIQECRKLFPNHNVIYNSTKIAVATKKALDKRTRDIAVPTEPHFTGPSDTDCFCMASEIKKAIQTAPLTTPIKQLLETGQMVAIQHKEGLVRHARISLDEYGICLHYLQDKPVPAHSFTIPFQEVMDRVDVSSALAFLDLSWPGSPPRRVYIRIDLNEESGFGRQFILMCTAELGPTHANTRFTKVYKKGEAFECILGGDYDGKGGKAIVDGLKTGENKVPYSEGLLRYSLLNKEVSTCFYINTNDKENYNMYAFGKVEKGLDVVKAAINENPNIRNVTIVDCGVVVLPR